jgi:hypothetical protein
MVDEIHEWLVKCGHTDIVSDPDYDGPIKSLSDMSPWMACDCCGEYGCVIHMVHTSEPECTCPEIGVWIAAGRDPYEPDTLNDDLLEWVRSNPYEEE